MIQLDLFKHKAGMGEYSRRYKYMWHTNADALPMVLKEKMDQICTHAWGWEFRPLDYLGTDEAGNQLILSFEDKEDLALCKLCVGHELK